MKYYIIAGEASGDLHGSNLIKALKEKDGQANIRCWGGDLMEAAGGKVVKHYRDLAFMGFWEVLKNIRTIFKNIRFCKSDISAFQPDALILIDYPGFNLRIADWAKMEGLKVNYYISPQLWAWHSSRVKKIKKSVDRMFVILPFEKDFYQKYDYKVDFVGHPLLDVVNQYAPVENFKEKNKLSEHPIIALLPGSRKQEISRMLPEMIKVKEYFPDYQFVIAAAPSIPAEYYQELIGATEGIKIVHGQTYDLLSNAGAALVTSGTATLETGLFSVPQVVCYKGSRFSYLIAKRLVNVKYISLVNLILDQPLLKELIQDEFNVENLKIELTKVLDEQQAKKMKEGYRSLKEKLGNSGASEKTADLVLKYLRQE